MELAKRIKQAKRTYIIGNGGSSANASHMVNDLVASGIRAYTIDPATLSAFANDHGWYQAFAKWLRVVGEPGDLLIAFSGSGKSPNILMACEEAEKIGMDVYREYGAAQGFDMQSAEERQIFLGHEVMRCLRRN